MGALKGKIEDALKGENPSEEIKKAIGDMLADMGIEVNKDEK